MPGSMRAIGRIALRHGRHTGSNEVMSALSLRTSPIFSQPIAKTASFATAGPPPPHPMTTTSGGISEIHPIFGDAANGAVETDVVPHTRPLERSRLRVEPGPFGEEPTDREHLQRVGNLADVRALVGRHRAKDLHALLAGKRGEPDARSHALCVRVQQCGDELGGPLHRTFGLFD